MDWRAQQPLSRWLRIGTIAFFVSLLLFGVLVERRSALMQRRMGDLDVFLRAAWAVRNDVDLYEVASENGWHYIYPPLYAILLTPLADPPPDAERSGYLPYAVSVGICYLLNLCCLIFGVHALASALEERSDDPAFRTQPRFCLRWWALRLWPVFICMLPIGHTLMRGQANVFVLAILCAALAGWIRGQSFRAGAWLALAICIKVIPAYLLIYPLWKRDGRALLACSIGCIVGLVLIPGLAFGPTRAVEHYATYGKVFFGPLLKVSDDDSHKEEILGVNATDSIGVKNALHNWMYPYPPRSFRADEIVKRLMWYDKNKDGKISSAELPADMQYLIAENDLNNDGALDQGELRTYALKRTAAASNGPTRPADLTTGAKAAYVLLGLAMTFLTLWPSSDSTTRIAHVFGGLIVLMTIFSPVCHSHYLLFCVPIVMSLLAQVWQHQATIKVPWPITCCLLAFAGVTGIAYLPGLEILKDRCAALFATLPLWGIPIAHLWRGQTLIPQSRIASCRVIAKNPQRAGSVSDAKGQQEPVANALTLPARCGHVVKCQRLLPLAIPGPPSQRAGRGR